MAEEKRNIMTEDGLRKLQEQLDYLVGVRRNEVAHKIEVARGFGDLSENSEYDEAKNEQAELEVISDNQNAIALYKSLGFEKYGTFPNNIKYSDGTYANADWMMKQL